MRISPWSPTRRFRPPYAAAVALVLAGLVGVMTVLFATPPTTIRGMAEVVDGDTLRIGGTRIRLLGIDAPERDQPCTRADGTVWDCGVAARDFAVSLVGRSVVVCTSTGRDRYGRSLAKCDVGGTDLAAGIVAAGWAVAELPYAPVEAQARAARFGIWSGTFVAPADWRRDHGQGLGSFFDWVRSWFP